jgi:ATP-binding cassette subfamily F protein uup
MLVEFGGTLLLVSHDRAFLNEVCTSLLVYEAEARVVEYLGGYDDWQKEKAAKAAAAAAAEEKAKRDAKEAAEAAAGGGAAKKRASSRTRSARSSMRCRR